jgi:hypothetical protein
VCDVQVTPQRVHHPVPRHQENGQKLAGNVRHPSLDVPLLCLNLVRVRNERKGEPKMPKFDVTKLNACSTFGG